MKHPCATFSDTGHTVHTTKIGVPTENTTENWTTKSWHFILQITYVQITMKPAFATFSDSRHAVQTTKISFPTQSTTDNWTTKS